MPHARMLMPGRSAISLRCAIAFGSSSISIASLVPFGFVGDHTLAFAAVKKLSASFASSRSRMCGIVTPSAPASRISFTRACVASAPSLLIGGMRTISVLRLAFLRPCAVGLHGRGIVGAFEIEEDVVVERIRRRLRGALRGVDRRLAALRFARRVDAEGDLALRPQIEDLRVGCAAIQRQRQETPERRCYRPRMSTAMHRFTDERAAASEASRGVDSKDDVPRSFEPGYSSRTRRVCELHLEPLESAGTFDLSCAAWLTKQRRFATRSAQARGVGGRGADDAGHAGGARRCQRTGAAGGGSAAQSAAPRREPIENLTAAEADTLEAICARIIPSDANGPGAREARAAHYIDRALGGALKESREAYRAGFAAFDRYCRSSRGAAFVELSTRDQDSVLMDVESGSATGFVGSSARVLRHGAHAHAARHVRRSVLRRQREFRRLGSDRIPGLRLNVSVGGSAAWRQADTDASIGLRHTTCSPKRKPRSREPRSREPGAESEATWPLGSKTPTSSSSASAPRAAWRCCRSRRPASTSSASKPARG